MLNKRGAVFHWIVFGIIGALGLFLYLAYNAPGLQTVRGTWSQGLLYDGFFPAELHLLEQDVKLQHLFRETAQEIALSGGFLSSSPCGKIENKNIWDDGEILDDGCFPDILNEFQQLFVLRLRLSEKYSQYSFSEINFKDNYLVGKRAYSFQPSQLNKMPPSSVLSYSIPAGFSFDASSYIDAYTNVAEQAKALLRECRNQKELSACLPLKFKDLPKLHDASCTSQPVVDPIARTLVTCVQEGIFQFQFALDFTPDEPFAVESAEVLYLPSRNGYELRFPMDSFAESYKIYYTDVLEFDKTSGSAEEVFNQAIYGFLQEKVIHESEIKKSCPPEAEREKGKAYLCENEVVYLIDDSRLTGEGDYVFGVTALRRGKESEILFLMKIEKGDLFAKRI